MPIKDKTGPQGLGPKTGRQMGNCENAEPDVEKGMGFGARGCGMRRGFGRCQGRRYGYRNSAVLTKDQEKKILEAEKQEIENRLKEFN